jgi:hypothetical protein
MVIRICPERDDYHAPFAHRLVIPKTLVVMRGENGPYVITKPDSPVFIICANCGCWIGRYVPRCGCRLRCHREPVK